MTTHDSQSWNVYTGTLLAHAHEVDGVAYVGGRGQRLDVLLAKAYEDEARQLGNDLAECLARLDPEQAHRVLDSMKGALDHAAGSRHAMRAPADLLPTMADDEPTATWHMADDQPVPTATWHDSEQVGQALEGPGALTDALPPEPESETRRRRRHNDAAAALDEHREPEQAHADG